MTRHVRSWAIAALAARFVVAVVAVCTCASPTHAGLTWDWSFGGTEAGTFVTDGTLADAAGADAANLFTFTITSFSVMTSTESFLVGRSYTENQPVQSFQWDGSNARLFYRDNGNSDDMSNFFLYDNPDYFFAFTPSAGTLYGPGQNILVFSPELQLSPVASGVPEIDPTNLGSILALVLGALGLLERRWLKAA